MRALVLEGGAMRGIFTAGVLDALVEQGEPDFELVVGVSAGACCAASFLARQTFRNYVVFIELMTRPDFINPARLLRGGSVVDMAYLVGPVTHDLYPLDVDAIRSSSARFEAVATHARSGEASYLCAQGPDCVDALHATVSIPVFYRGAPASFRGEPYFDGAFSEPVPLRRALTQGATDITVILTRPRSWRAKPTSGLARVVLGRELSGYPAILDAVTVYDRTSQAARAFLDEPSSEVSLTVYLPPEDFPVTRFTRDPEVLHHGYMMGKSVARAGGVPVGVTKVD